jgi:2-polyprenyl-6-methoxyphenol hydroxylase-like FAD-dependent oxidoreductase
MAYDVIVVGTRAAGAATAMLLARQGLRVLAVDRSRFPSDTLSTHQVQLPGVARLHRWGLLDQIRAAGTPPTRRVRFDLGAGVIEGEFAAHDGVDALYSPRRTVLDALLVDAARAAGAELREGFAVTDLVRDGGRITGIRGRTRDGATHTEAAALVIGADGKGSLVATAVGAGPYRTRPGTTMMSYTYWRGVPVTHGEFYLRPRAAAVAFPTNDDLTMVAVVAPVQEFPAFRLDIEAAYLAILSGCGDLGERVRDGERAERIRTTPHLPNAFRVPHGPGWALVGDAGLVMDPVTAQGISNAFRDAELLADAVHTALAAGRRPDDDLAGYHRRRDAAAGPMYDFTVALAEFNPLSAASRRLFAALPGNRPAIARFLAMYAGVAPVREFLSPRSVLRVLGVRGVAGLTVDLLRQRQG